MLCRCSGSKIKLLKTNAAIQKIKIKVKVSHYRPGVAQRVGRGIALLFHDRGTRRGWVVSSTGHFIPRKETVPILLEAGRASGSVWTGRKISSPTGIWYRTVQHVVSRYTDWATGQTNAGVWFNKMCRYKYIKPNYIYMKINWSSPLDMCCHRTAQNITT